MALSAPQRQSPLMCEEPPLCPRAAMVAKVESVRGWIRTMAELEDAQSEASQVAARTRQVIAKKIAKLVPKVEVDTEAQVVLHLAEAYGHLAIEPPRTRTR